MRTEGNLILLVNDLDSLNNVSGESITIPGSGGVYGSYVARLAQLPHPDYGVTIAGKTEVTALPVADNQFYVDYKRGLVTFYSGDATESVSASYKGRGTIIDALDFNLIQTVANIHLFWSGELYVPSNGDFCLAVPLGAILSQSQFGACDLNQIVAQGLSVFAQVTEGLTDNTVIVLSNDTKGSGGDTITCTLTHTGATTDRYISANGTVTLDMSTDALYIYATTVGGHADFNIHIWFRRNSP